MSASSSTLSFQSPLARMRGGFRDALVLALVAAATTWVALLSWKGFAIDYSGFMGPLIVIGVVVAAERRRAALAAGAGGAPRARPAGHRRHGRVALPHRLARADRRGVAAARGGLPGRVGDRAPVRRPGATRRPSHRPVAHRRRGRVHAARRHHGRHPASRAAGRPAAADDLQHPGQPAGRRRLVDHLHAHHHRLPADAVPPGEPSDRALGPSARQTTAWTRAGSASATAPCAPRRARSAPPRRRWRSSSRSSSRPSASSCSATGSARAAATRSRSRTRRSTSSATSSRAATSPVITIQTDDPNPGYLRISVLNRFSDNEWSPGDRQAPGDQRAIGELPPITGLSSSRADQGVRLPRQHRRQLRLPLAAHPVPRSRRSTRSATGATTARRWT